MITFSAFVVTLFYFAYFPENSFKSAKYEIAMRDWIYTNTKTGKYSFEDERLETS